MDNFFNKEVYTLADVQSLIETEAEETVYLEFKSAGSLAKEDVKTIEIGKDVSAFANSDGGIIIYGLKEKNHIADSLNFIDGNLITKEWLESIINGKINRVISGVKIFPIRVDNDFKKTLYIVKVPSSPMAPHINYDRKYYKRNNFSAEPMQEYEVRNLYERVNKAELQIQNLVYERLHPVTGTNEIIRQLSFQLRFEVKNISNQIEANYKVEMHIGIEIVGSDYPKIAKNILRSEGSLYVLSFPNSSPIFPNELTTILSIQVYLRDNLSLILEEPIKVLLYYSGGIKERIFDLATLLTYQGKPIKEFLK